MLVSRVLTHDPPAVACVNLEGAGLGVERRRPSALEAGGRPLRLGRDIVQALVDIRVEREYRPEAGSLRLVCGRGGQSGSTAPTAGPRATDRR
jgi:hypothetical protein